MIVKSAEHWQEVFLAGVLLAAIGAVVFIAARSGELTRRQTAAVVIATPAVAWTALNLLERFLD